MISTRLVQLIEEHAEGITDRVIVQHRRDPRLTHLTHLPESEVRDRCQEILKRLGHWLAESDEREITTHFEAIGRARAHERVPLESVVWAFQVLKNRMLDYIRDQGIGLSTVEIYAEEELEHQVGVFFDSVIYHVVRGYQNADVKVAVNVG
jgi:hypothetical protein